MTYCSDDLFNSNFYIIVVPTPIDSKNKPDLSYLFSAPETIARKLKKGIYSYMNLQSTLE